MAPGALFASFDTALHETAFISVLIRFHGAGIEPSEYLLFRAALLSPLVNPLYKVDRAPDFELNRIFLVRFCDTGIKWTSAGCRRTHTADLECVYVPIYVGLRVRLFHLDAQRYLRLGLQIRLDPV